MPKTATIELVFTSECCTKLVEAAELLREIHRDYPDDARFQAVVDKVMDAVGSSTDA
jgi:hypothetical protein